MDEYVDNRLDTVLQNVSMIAVEQEYGSIIYNLAVGIQEIIDCIRILHSEGGDTVEPAHPR